MPPSGLTMGKSARNVAAAAEGRSCSTCPMAICAFMVSVRFPGNRVYPARRGRPLASYRAGIGRARSTFGVRPAHEHSALGDLLLQIRVALDAGFWLCRFRNWLVIESDGIRCGYAVTFARNWLPASGRLRGLGSRCRFVESTLVEIGDRVARDRVVTVPA